MKHLTAQQLSASLDGALNGAELESLVQHLGSCRECRDRHSRWSKHHDALRRMLAFEPSERQLADSLARVEAALHAEVRDVPRAPATPPPPVVPTPTIDLQSVPAAAPSAPRAARAARAPLRIPPALLAAAAAVAIAALLFTVVKQLPARRPASHTASRDASVRAPHVTPTPVPTASVVPPAPPVVAAPPTPAAPATAKTAAPARNSARVAEPAPATPRPAMKPAVPPAESAHADEGADWPLLCGVVTDAEGAPVAGAKVSLADLDLSARTDRRGRFCIAAPPGERTLSVLAQGFASARRLVALGPSGLELQVTLADRE